MIAWLSVFGSQWSIWHEVANAATRLSTFAGSHSSKHRERSASFSSKYQRDLGDLVVDKTIVALPTRSEVPDYGCKAIHQPLNVT